MFMTFLYICSVFVYVNTNKNKYIHMVVGLMAPKDVLEPLEPVDPALFMAKGALQV